MHAYYVVITNRELVGLFDFAAANAVGQAHRRGGNSVLVRRATQAEIAAYEREYLQELQMLARVYGDEHINF